MNGPSRPEDTQISEQAACWHVASRRDDMDWDGFTLWLEADPRHRVCYAEIALADALVEKHRAGLNRKAQGFGISRARRVWGVGAMAAALVAAVMLPTLLRTTETRFTTQGSSRTIALSDGSQVVLAPHSQLVASGKDMAHLTLTGGAWFDVRHNPARTLDITAGSVDIRDIGTQFDVRVDGKVVRVAVEEGKVTVGADALGRPIELTRGRALRFDAGAHLAGVASIDPSGAGSWRSGQLRYENAPLGLVAKDLARYGNVQLDVTAPLQDRRFTGILTIRNADGTIHDLAKLMDLSLVRDTDGYRLTSGHD